MSGTRLTYRLPDPDSMQPLHLALALGPLGIYLLVLGIVNLRRSPSLNSGGRDLTALAVGAVGLVAVGPMDLFVPESAFAVFGPYVWLMLLSIYALAVTLAVLLSRPRLVIYNVRLDELRPVLAGVAERIDGESYWAVDTLVLPSLGVQLYLEPFAAMRSVSLVASGPRQSPAGWDELEQALRPALKEVAVSRNPRGYSMVFFGALMLALAAWRFTTNLSRVEQQWWDLLRM